MESCDKQRIDGGSGLVAANNYLTQKSKAAHSCRLFYDFNIFMLRFVPPLFDRLIDVTPLDRTEPLRPALSMNQLKNSVARDIESLLNSRRGITIVPVINFPNVRASIAAFGLDDFVSMSMSSEKDRDDICKSIERALVDYEPRLRNARVVLERRDESTQKLRFSIHATLHAHPLQEPVNFDAVLQTTTQNYSVQLGRRES
jgi:type VI secretion system protein ImpF